jgi:putative FmdB family regulatory protein
MPIYEYRCPNGHTFERFQSMTAPAPEKCDVCGAAPLELVLYPIAIHYKGSGFYSTDYGKKGAAAAKKDGGESGSSSGDSSSGDSSGGGDSSAPKTDAKPAADKKPSSSSD